MHDIEAEIMSLNGVPVFDKPLTESMPLIDSPHNQIDVLWQKSLEFLASKSPWLSRKNAVSVHRCREVIGVTPEIGKNILTERLIRAKWQNSQLSNCKFGFETFCTFGL